MLQTEFIPVKLINDKIVFKLFVFVLNKFIYALNFCSHEKHLCKIFPSVFMLSNRNVVCLHSATCFYFLYLLETVIPIQLRWTTTTSTFGLHNTKWNCIWNLNKKVDGIIIAVLDCKRNRVFQLKRWIEVSNNPQIRFLHFTNNKKKIPSKASHSLLCTIWRHGPYHVVIEIQ